MHRNANIFEINEFLKHHKGFKDFHDSTLIREDLINFSNSNSHTKWLFEYSEETKVAELIMNTNTAQGVLTYKAYLQKTDDTPQIVDKELLLEN